MKTPSISIAIVFKDLYTPFLLETINNCLQLDYYNYGIYLFPDEMINMPVKDDRVQIFPTGVKNIPAKRNTAIKRICENADFIAFIDADASPECNWLKNAVSYFSNPEIMAVGGPNITPENEAISRRISGYVMQQKIGFGSGAIRHKCSTPQFVNELPTCNLIIRTEYAKHHLFNESYTNAEDMKYCHDIINNNYKIYYANDVIVHHHRKKMLFPFARQIYYYGYYRCTLFLSGTSKSKQFIIPTLFLLFLLIFSFAGLFNPIITFSLLAVLLLYFAICFLNSLFVIKHFVHSIFTTLGIFACHISYGFGFLVCLIKSKFKSRVIEMRQK